MKPNGVSERWLRFFPRSWRTRYGEELDALVADLQEADDLRPSDRIDLVRGGLAVRRQRVGRRPVYRAVGVGVGAVGALVGLAVTGELGVTASRAPAPERAVVLPVRAVSLSSSTRQEVWVCRVIDRTGHHEVCELSIAPAPQRGRGVTIYVRSLGPKS